MTKKIQRTDPRVIGFLTRTIQKLEVQYPQLKDHSKYRILFERKTDSNYSLSFWCEPKEGVQQKRRIEIPIIRVHEDQWFEWQESELTDNSSRQFVVPLNPFMTFHLTFAVKRENDQLRIVLKSIRPEGFAQISLASETNYETRTSTA